jgi:hypothetical protein
MVRRAMENIVAKMAQDIVNIKSGRKTLGRDLLSDALICSTFWLSTPRLDRMGIVAMFERTGEQIGGTKH